VLATGLTSPWGLTFLPDGRALVGERDTARVLLVRPDGTARPLGTVPGVLHGGEGGLLGLAVAPDEPGTVLAYRTTATGNEVVRLRFDEDGLGPPEVVLRGIPAAGIHNGGQLAFGPDGMLYVTTGDAAVVATAPDPGSLGGKILRLDLTRRDLVPRDNPIPGSLVWSLGHRNVQGLDWADDGTLWAAEFGQDTWDELNAVVPGGDYGWPGAEGAVARAGLQDPRVQWPTDQASPSGLAVVDDPDGGATVFLAGLRGQRLWAVPVVSDRAGDPVARLTGDYGRLRAVAEAPDGSLWLMTSNTDGRGVPAPDDDRILRLTLR
jgi:glucose/arabinose dehydrogenase